MPRAAWAGLAFVAAALAGLEATSPYFFCQDDALVLELPTVLFGMRAVWRGIWPVYDPFIFLGSPTPVIAGVYPPLYFAYAVARHVLGDEHATFDVSAVLHLVAGYGLAFTVARRLSIRPALAALAALTFVLSGPVVVMARCWHSFAALAVFIPLFALCVDRLRSGAVTWRWPVATGLAIGVFYHAGFPQLFVLGCGVMLVHAAALAVFGLVPWRRLAWLVPALVLGAAVALPVFHQQWRLLGEVSIDDPGSGERLERNLLSTLLPYPLVEGTLPNHWCNAHPERGGHFYYFGTVLAVGFLAAVIGLVRRPGRAVAGRAAALQAALAVPAAVAFLLALGEWGGLWWLMDLLPVGLRNNSFRALPWFVFFSCLVGALFFEDRASEPQASSGPLPERNRRLELAGVLATGLLLMALHLAHVDVAFFAYGFPPYPPLPSALAAVLGAEPGRPTSRIMSFAAMRSTDPSYPLVAPHNLPCHYGLPAFFGYDPLVQRFGRFRACVQRVDAAPAEALAAYGVRWLVAHRTTWGGWLPQTRSRFERVIPFLGVLKTLGGNRALDMPELGDRLVVMEVPNAAPLAFDAAAPTVPLALRADAAGLDIDIDPVPQARRVIANFLRYPDMAATADGRPAVVGEDQWQRIVVEVPAGARTVHVGYRPPRLLGLILAATALAFGLTVLPACRVFAD